MQRKPIVFHFHVRQGIHTNDYDELLIDVPEELVLKSRASISINRIREKLACYSAAIQNIVAQGYDMTYITMDDYGFPKTLTMRRSKTNEFLPGAQETKYAPTLKERFSYNMQTLKLAHGEEVDCMCITHTGE